ncbi:MAG: hypothetical protein QUV07_03390 [Cyanobium sp. CZS 25K]|nr:hypothetical protein [Cyanobium sp. CZS25K]
MGMAVFPATSRVVISRFVIRRMFKSSDLLDPNGSVRLLWDTITGLVSAEIKGVMARLRYKGAQVTASQLKGWQILAAETLGNG